MKKLKTKHYIIFLFLILINLSLFSQNASIVGSWKSEDDNNWELLFLSNNKCYQYYSGVLNETDFWTISNTSPQCGVAVYVDENTSYLQLQDAKDSVILCYEINGITDTILSIRPVDRGGVIVFDKQPINFKGNWYMDGGSFDFSLTLNQFHSTITGNHCAMYDNGNFIDCSDDTNGKYSINGKVQGDSAIITFVSGYSGAGGTAVMKKIKPTQILWRITKKPDDMYYIPNDVIMNLEKDTIVKDSNSPIEKR